MDQGLEIEIIEYDTMYALETIKMWRASTEKVLGIKDKHTWTQQLDYLAEIVREYQVVLAIDHRTGTVIGMMAMAGKWEEFWHQPDLTDQLFEAFNERNEVAKKDALEAA